MPPLTVTAPNGGESYAAGSAQTVSWTVSPAQSSGLYAVWAVSASNTHYWLGSRNAIGGQTAYTLPWTVSLPAGSYRVRVSYALS